MSSISPLTTTNILPPTIPHIGPSLSSESEDEGGEKLEEQQIGHSSTSEIQSEAPIISGQPNTLGIFLN